VCRVLEEQVSDLLSKRGLSIAFAESCTGGLVSHRITNVPGSSKYYLGSVVSYSNEVKNRLLLVRQETLENFGAVSHQCATEMAKGVRNLIGSDIGVAITGILGPGGSTIEKPVGLVYISLSSKDSVDYKKFKFNKSRIENKNSTADAALNMLLAYLKTSHTKDS